MAVINVDDIYILNETGAQVDKVTGLFTKDEDTTSGEKAFAQLNIGTAGSNRNLLDNAYFVGGGSQLGNGIFPINQRGQTSYQIQGTTIDRWKSNSPWGSIANVTLEEGGLVIAGRIETSYPTSYVQLSQVLETPPVGKTVTLSVLCDNVSPDSEGNYPQIWCGSSVNKRITAEGLTSLTFTWPSAETSIGIVVDNGATQASAIRLQAAKLELGSVSTLANDAPPNYAEELAKCQYYFQRLNFTINQALATGWAYSATSVRMVLPVPHPMRAVPTLSYNGTFAVQGELASLTITGLAIASQVPQGFANIVATVSGATAKALYVATCGTSGAYIDLSADL